MSPGVTLSSGAKSLGALGLSVFHLSNEEAVLQVPARAEPCGIDRAVSPGQSGALPLCPVYRAASGELS